MISGLRCKHLDQATGLCRETPRHWSAETMRVAKGKWRCPLVKWKGYCYHAKLMPPRVPRKDNG